MTSIEPRLDDLRSMLQQALDTFGSEGTVEVKALEGSVFATLEVLGKDAREVLEQIMTLVVAFADAKRLTVTSDQQRVAQGFRLSLSLTPDKNLQTFNDLDTIEAIVNDLIRAFKTELNLRLKRRSRSQLPDPTKSHRAFVNRNKSTRKQVKFEMEPRDVERLTEFNKASGMTKREIIQEALELYYAHKGWDTSEEEPKPE